MEVSESRYRRLFETAQDGILILNAETGTIIDVNPFLIDLTGYSHEEFLNKHLWEIGPFKDVAATRSVKLYVVFLSRKPRVRPTLPLVSATEALEAPKTTCRPDSRCPSPAATARACGT